MNIGAGVGTSVKQMIDQIAVAAGIRLLPQTHARRAGDPAAVVASVERIYATTGWKARFGLTEIVASAWEAHRELRTRET
jgi:UDP-glucose 4-epimerase